MSSEIQTWDKVMSVAMSVPGVKVNRKEVETLLKLWNKGKLKKGMTISHYTIIEIKADFVKVGCHKIPTENIKALFNQMNNQQQEAA